MKRKDGKGKVQKVTKSLLNISRICGEAPSKTILARLCTSREVADFIIYADLGVYKLRG